MVDGAESRQGRAGAYRPAIALLAVALAALGWQQLSPGETTRTLLVVLPLAATPSALLASVPDASVLGPGRIPHSWIVTGVGPDLAGRLKAGGAWLVLEADRIPDPCGPAATTI